MKHQYLFLVSFAVSFYLSLFLLTDNQETKIAEVEIQPVLAEETPTPAASAALQAGRPEPTQVVTPQSKVETPLPTLTSTPNPTPTPDVWAPPAMESAFSSYAGQYGVDKNILERLANCESHFNPNAKNGIYLGMFQFSPNTWVANRQAIGADTNLDLRSNIDESIKTAAYLLSHRGTDPWPNCLR